MELPGGLVVRIKHFHCCGLESIPGWGTDHASYMVQPKEKKERERERECLMCKIIHSLKLLCKHVYR